MRKLQLFIVVAVAVTFLNTTMAMALSFSVVDIFGDGNAVNAATGENQLFIDVTDPGSNQVLFTFENFGPNASSITQIYFEEGASGPLFDVNEIKDSDVGVSFTEQTGNLGRPPGAQNIGWANNATAFGFDSDSPTQPNGINPGEALGILFDLAAGYTFDNVITGLTTDGDGGWRIGFHVQGFADGGSDAFVIGSPGQTPAPVPEPATMILFGAGLVGLIGAARRKKK